MKKVMVGNHAVSWGARLARVEVISAYPITPQTQIVEELSEMCADGRLDARFIKVESEHSAMAACVGASAAGARAFTATSSQGLALMHEMLHWAANGRLPIVMADVNRALGPGWNIWTDQSDSLAQRDTGWVQLYCETNQEVLDTTLIAFKLAETVDLPVMLVLDAFFLSHTAEPVDVPDQDKADVFLGARQARYKLDVDDPRAFGALVKPDAYMEMRWHLQQAMQRVPEVLAQVEREFAERFGRRYEAVECYRVEGADLVLLTSGTITSTARFVVNRLRERGEAVGLIKVKMFRPFPAEPLRAALMRRGVERVAVLDRNLSPGRGGIFAEELKAALYGGDGALAPKVFDYIVGLGGRDVTPQVIEDIVAQTRAADAPAPEDTWVGVTP
jgi:pyruvate/2-oxoacid:ferredoxin oxidoreductase alpha subunit